MTLGQILNILEIAGPLWALFLWIMRPRKDKPPPPDVTPQQKIGLARQAFAQDAITIDELERVIENAIKDGA